MSMRTEVSGLNGGKKQLWLNEHRREVEDYYFQHGADDTMLEFNLTQGTLSRFLERRSREEHKGIERLSAADRYVLSQTKASLAELRGRLNRLEDFQQEVTPVFEAMRAWINATFSEFQRKVVLPQVTGETNRLNNFDAKSRRHD